MAHGYDPSRVDINALFRQQRREVSLAPAIDILGILLGAVVQRHLGTEGVIRRDDDKSCLYEVADLLTGNHGPRPDDETPAMECESCVQVASISVTARRMP